MSRVSLCLMCLSLCLMCHSLCLTFLFLSVSVFDSLWSLLRLMNCGLLPVNSLPLLKVSPTNCRFRQCLQNDRKRAEYVALMCDGGCLVLWRIFFWYRGTFHYVMKIWFVSQQKEFCGAHMFVWRKHMVKTYRRCSEHNATCSPCIHFLSNTWDFFRYL